MNSSNKIIAIKASAYKKVMEKHPWIYSKGIEFVTPDTSNGDIVKVISLQDKFIGYAFYNKHSKIAARLLSYASDFDLVNWLANAIENAVVYRKGFLNRENTACRLINSDADGIPGLIVDDYNNSFAVSFLTAGVDKMKHEIVKMLKKYNPNVIYEVNDTIRKKEGLEESSGLLYGTYLQNTIIEEHTLRYHVYIGQGHKTGHYLDQSNNHYKIRQYVERKKVLDTFCYTGGFTLNSFMGNAQEVTSIDSSEWAMNLLRQNILENNPQWLTLWNPIKGKTVETCKNLISQGKKYDVVISDPPKLAPHRKNLKNALRYYKELCMIDMKLLNENGIGVFFSCSQSVSIETLCEVIRWAAIDVKREVIVLDILLQAKDHRYLVTVPETLYLKGVVCKVL